MIKGILLMTLTQAKTNFLHETYSYIKAEEVFESQRSCLNSNSTERYILIANVLNLDELFAEEDEKKEALRGVTKTS